MAAEHALPALGADLGQRRVGLHLQQVGMRLRDLLVQLRAVDYRQHLPRLHRLADVGAPRLQVAAHAGVDRCFGPGTQVRRQCHRSRSTPRPGGDHLHRRHRLALGPLDHGVCLLRAQGQATGNEDDHHGGGQDQRTAQRMLRQRRLRHAGQRGARGQQQAADHRAAQRCILFSGQCSRQHAQDHRQRGHADRAKAGKPPFQCGLDRVAVLGQALAAETDHQDRIGRGHAHAQDGPGQRRHRQRGVGQEQHPDHACQARRQRGDDHERIGPGLEVDDDQQVDQHDRGQQAVAEAGEGHVQRIDLAVQANLAWVARCNG
ncbi:hypothetical protein G6F35_012709 [Rhizopus arrhizus]|nr:hypothetical protein G6F35_012709 [Rhizopus arrhizus]